MRYCKTGYISDPQLKRLIEISMAPSKDVLDNLKVRDTSFWYRKG